jgi:hypothetical protein
MRICKRNGLLVVGEKRTARREGFLAISVRGKWMGHNRSEFALSGVRFPDICA